MFLNGIQKVATKFNIYIHGGNVLTMLGYTGSLLVTIAIFPWNIIRFVTDHSYEQYKKVSEEACDEHECFIIQNTNLLLFNNAQKAEYWKSQAYLAIDSNNITQLRKAVFELLDLITSSANQAVAAFGSDLTM